MIKYEHRVWRLRLSWKQDEGLLSVFYKNKWIPIDRIPEEGWELVAIISNELTGDVDSKNKSKQLGNQLLHIGVFKRKVSDSHEVGGVQTYVGRRVPA
jgi:hypothetical protein